jgi:RNA polymerase sigma-70 factor (ECF subfamily)
MTDATARPQTAPVDAAPATADAPPRRPAPAPPPAFVVLYREHFAYVWRSLRRLGIREADLPDLAHDVFVVVHRKLGDFDGSRPAKPWLFGICFRVALDKKRRHASFKESLVDSVDERAIAGERAADDVVEAREAHAAVMKALDVLDFDKRAVFVLHELEGMSMPEIAQIVDAPLNTLYSRLRLAREAFVAEVRKKHP